MYETDYGTDWRTLALEEAIERAFALGVSAALGEPRPEERERVYGSVGSSYERSVVELAYDEGKARVEALDAEADDPEEVWEKAIVTRDGRETETVDVSEEFPPALGRAEMLDPPGDDLGPVRLPEFLLRR